MSVRKAATTRLLALLPAPGAGVPWALPERLCACGARLARSEQRCLDCRTFVCAYCVAVFVAKNGRGKPIYCSRACYIAAEVR